MRVTGPSNPLQGSIYLPGDKSISHRAAILGSLCEGKVHVHHFLLSEDCLNTVKAMQQLGVMIEVSGDKLMIQGVGLHGLKASTKPIDCGNSGTSIRLLAGLLVGQAFESELFGDASLLQRPMDRVIKPLEKMGATVSGTVHGGCSYPPLKVIGRHPLEAIEYKMPISSAQVKSCLLLAGLFAQGTTVIDQGKPSRDHTERMLSLMGVEVQQDGEVLSMRSGPLNTSKIEIPGDISSAAFFMVAASLIEGSHITLRHVGLNPTRLGVIHILKAMGANIVVHQKDGFEPVGDIEVKSASLRGITIPKEWVVSAMDEFPILFIAAAFAKGQTILKGAKELRVKESDRIQTMADNLLACGIKVDTFEDGLSIDGGGFKGGEVDSYGDHRVAMAFAIAGFCSKNSVDIHDTDCIATSFPSFFALAKDLGLGASPKVRSET